MSFFSKSVLDQESLANCNFFDFQQTQINPHQTADFECRIRLKHECSMKQRDGLKLTIAACVFCKGKGKDPFEIMSVLSNCPVCIGRGKVEIPENHMTCAHCQGTGAINTFTCNACQGKGRLLAITGGSIVCPDCQGSGDDRSATGMDCLKCRGRGRIPKPESSFQTTKAEQ